MVLCIGVIQTRRCKTSCYIEQVRELGINCYIAAVYDILVSTVVVVARNTSDVHIVTLTRYGDVTILGVLDICDLVEVACLVYYNTDYTTNLAILTSEVVDLGDGDRGIVLTVCDVTLQSVVCGYIAHYATHPIGHLTCTFRLCGVVDKDWTTIDATVEVGVNLSRCTEVYIKLTNNTAWIAECRCGAVRCDRLLNSDRCVVYAILEIYTVADTN